MPAWLITFLISAAIRLGLAWLVKHFPGLPPEIVKIIEELLQILGDSNASRQEKQSAKDAARQKIKDACSGTGCPTEIKKD